MIEIVKLNTNTYHKVYIGQAWDRAQEHGQWNQIPKDVLLEIVKHYQEMHQWMVEKFGPELDWSHKNRTWFGSDRHYYFLNKDDCLLFVLKWLTA